MDFSDVLQKMQGGSWSKFSEILNEIDHESVRYSNKDENTIYYSAFAQKLPAEGRHIYLVDPKEDSICLSQCPSCEMPIMPAAMQWHIDTRHKKVLRTADESETTSDLSPSKKKRSKMKDTVAYEEELESSSTPPTPTVVSINDILNESIPTLPIIEIHTINSPHDETPSEDSKPPTPGPQDLYEEFSVPTSNDITSCSVSFSNSIPVYNVKPLPSTPTGTESLQQETTPSLLASPPPSSLPSPPPSLPSCSNTKPSRPMSLLEAQLMAEPKVPCKKSTKYSNNSNVSPQIHPNVSQNLTTSVNEQNKFVGKRAQSYKSCGVTNEGTEILEAGNSEPSVCNYNETRISIPISAVPPKLKSSLKVKSPSSPVQDLDIKDKSLITPPPVKPSSFRTAKDYEPSTSPESSPKPKRSRRTRGKQSKKLMYDPDKHCGVVINELTTEICMHSLSCKDHSIFSKRTVTGRSKPLDFLLTGNKTPKVTKKRKMIYTEIKVEPTETVPNKKKEVTPKLPRTRSAITKGGKSDVSNFNKGTDDNDNTSSTTKSGTKFKSAKNCDKHITTKKNTHSAPKEDTVAQDAMPDLNTSLTEEMISDTESWDTADPLIQYLANPGFMTRAGGTIYESRTKLTTRSCFEDLFSEYKSDIEQPNVLQQSDNVYHCTLNLLQHPREVKQEMKKTGAMQKFKVVMVKKKIKEILKERHYHVKSVKKSVTYNEVLFEFDKEGSMNNLDRIIVKQKLPHHSGFHFGNTSTAEHNLKYGSKEDVLFSMDLRNNTIENSNENFNMPLHNGTSGNFSSQFFDADISNFELDKNSFDYVINDESLSMNNSPFLNLQEGINYLGSMTNTNNNVSVNINDNSCEQNTDEFLNVFNNIHDDVNGFNNSDNSRLVDNMSYDLYSDANMRNVSNFNTDENSPMFQGFSNSINTSVSDGVEIYESFYNSQNDSNIQHISNNTFPNANYNISNSDFRGNQSYNDECGMGNNLPSFVNSVDKNFSILEEYCKNMTEENIFGDEKSDVNNVFEGSSNDVMLSSIPVSNNTSVKLTLQNEDTITTSNSQNFNIPSNNEHLTFDSQLFRSYLVDLPPSQMENINDNFNPRSDDTTVLDDYTAGCDPMEMLQLTELSSGANDAYDFLSFNGPSSSGGMLIQTENPPKTSAVFNPDDSANSLNWL